MNEKKSILVSTLKQSWRENA